MTDDICLIQIVILIVIAVAIPKVLPTSILIMIAGIMAQTTIILSIPLMLLECDTIATFALIIPGLLDLGLIK